VCAGELPLNKKGGALSVRTYEVRVFVPAVYYIEAEDDADALEKVAEVYKRCYTKDFHDLVVPLSEPEDGA
jgi:hypothetical protein